MELTGILFDAVSAGGTFFRGAAGGCSAGFHCTSRLRRFTLRFCGARIRSSRSTIRLRFTLVSGGLCRCRAATLLQQAYLP